MRPSCTQVCVCVCVRARACEGYRGGGGIPRGEFSAGKTAKLVVQWCIKPVGRPAKLTPVEDAALEHVVHVPYSDICRIIAGCFVVLCVFWGSQSQDPLCLQCTQDLGGAEFSP